MTDYNAMHDDDVDEAFFERVCMHTPLEECNHCCRHEEPSGCQLFPTELKPEHYAYMRRVLRELDEREEAQQ